MKTTVTFRHMDATDALKTYAVDKIEKLSRFLNKPLSAEWVLSVEKKIHHKAECKLAADGEPIFAEENSEDMYNSIDRCEEKLERQLKKYKDKLKVRKGSGPRAHKSRKASPLPTDIVADDEPPPAPARDALPDGLTIDQAMLEMNLSNRNFIVFTNADSRQTNVVYRRTDGQFGLIEGHG